MCKAANAPKVMGKHSTSSSKQEPSKEKRGTTVRASHQPILVGSEVVIKSWTTANKKVALGTVLGQDPKQEVGGVRIGKEFWMVRVGIVAKRDEPLIRPYDKFETIGDVGNNPIAWPSRFIEKYKG